MADENSTMEVEREDLASQMEVEGENLEGENLASQMEVEGENLAMVIGEQTPKTAEPRYYEGTMFGLPREWTAEIRPRKASSKYAGKVDQFFYEPGTKRQFRSLKAVKKHLGFDVGSTSRQRKPKASKAAGQSENLNERDKFESKAAGQSENLNEKDKFESKAAGQSEPFHYFDKNVDEKDKVGASRKVAEEGKDEEHYQHFDKIAKRVRWQLINGEENSWDLYVKVPDAVQKRWMDMFLKPDNHNQESNPPGMK